MSETEYCCTLSEELLKIAEAELNERPQWRDRDVEALRQMVRTSPDLHCPTDYALMLRFLRAKKFDYDRAFTSLRRYYAARSKHREIFDNFVPSTVESLLKRGFVHILPQPDAKGRRIVWLRYAVWNPDEEPITDLFKATLLNLEYVVQDEKTQINGIVLLQDFNGVGWKHVRHFNRDRMKTLIFIVQEAFPIRLKGMHIVNAPSFMQYMFGIIKLFLKEKLKQRVSFIFLLLLLILI